MQNKELSIRENKSARIKLAILNSTLDAIGDGSFDEVFVIDICNKVGISKVTFFKYFHQKEDVLLYYLRVWCFHRAVELARNHLNGLDGVRYLFNCVSESCCQHPGIFLGLISHLSKLGMPVKPFPLKQAERELIYPEIENILEVEALSLDQFLQNFLLEAIFNKEITKSSNVKELLHLMDTVLYGSIITAHMKPSELASQIFKTNLETVLEGLRDIEEVTGPPEIARAQ